MAKILIVDDSALARNILRRILQEEHELLEATDGMQALELYYTERPDVVILDLTMPQMHGMDVLRQIRQVDPKARVIIGTADIQDHTWLRAQELGAAAVIYKPFQAETVAQTIKQVLEGEAYETHT